MTKPVRTIRLQRLQGQLGDVAYEMTRVHFSDLRAQTPWQPPINAYRCERGFHVCVDLAGIAKADIHLEIVPGELTIRGHRLLPEPNGAAGRAMQVLAMEIDHGRFERRLALPASIDSPRVTAEQYHGLLWIHLPLLPHA